MSFIFATPARKVTLKISQKHKWPVSFLADMSILCTVSVRGLLGVILRLGVPELGVFSRLLRQKRLMGSLLDHLTVAEHGDFVAEPAGRQPVADVDGRAVAGNGVELLVDLRLGNGVKGSGGFVQNDEGRVLVKAPGQWRSSAPRRRKPPRRPRQNPCRAWCPAPWAWPPAGRRSPRP